MANKQATPSQETPPQDDVAGELARLGAALAQVAGDKRQRDQVIGDLEHLLGRLTVKDYPDLTDNPVVQAFVDRLSQTKAETADDPPGTVYNAGMLSQHKRPWSWRDLRNMPTVTFTPAETLPVIYNGLRMQLVADEEITVPAPFHGIYMERRRALKTARQHAEWLFHRRDRVDDPTVLSAEGARVRATGSDGHYAPGAGNIAGANLPERSAPQIAEPETAQEDQDEQPSTS